MQACCTDLSMECHPGTDSGRGQALAWTRLGLAALIAGQAMTFDLASNLEGMEGLEKTVLHSILAGSAVVVFLLVGLPLLSESWRQLRRGRIVLEQFFLIGIAGAFAASVHSSLTGIGSVYYEVVTILLAIYTLGNLLASNRRRAALQSADLLRSEHERCFRLSPDGKSEEVPVASVRKGDRVLVNAGAAVSVDGRILQGEAFVSETALTGEPFPVVRRGGDPVLAGSRVLDQRLIVEATADGCDRKLDRLLQSVEQARNLPSMIQREADRLVAWFLPAVLMISVLTFMGWTWYSGWVNGLFNALAVLVVACPCAMGLATPIGLWNALGAFARRGLVARSGSLIENLARVDTVVFDKTGTLSEDALLLVDLTCAPGFDREEVRRWISALQAGSTHPIARAFDTWVGENKNAARVSDFKNVPGAGLEAVISDGDGSARVLRMGNKAILAAGMDAAVLSSALQGREGSVQEIYLTVDDRLAAMAVLRETLRSSSRRAVEQLQAAGFVVEIMTGDKLERVQALGFVEARAGLLPEEKARLIAEMEQRGQRVLFVGDGVNDSAAMANATASLAMGSGADLAREVAAGQLFGNDLEVVPWACRTARSVLRGIRQNLYFAACYNGVGMLLAVSGVLHPVVASILMLVSSVTVTWRALRFGEKLQAEAVGGPVAVETVFFLPVLLKGMGNWLAQRLSWLGLTFGFGLALQGLFLCYLGSLPMRTGLLLGFVFMLAGAVLALQLRQWFQRPLRVLYAGMLALGNLGMLFGWFMDAGFGPVVRGAEPLCGCGSALLQPTWMQAGMILASLPLLFGIQVAPAVVLRPGWNRSWLHALVCLTGMLAGMQAAMAVTELFQGGDRQRYFLALYGAMTCGMFLGMIVFCNAYFRFVIGRKTQ